MTNRPPDARKRAGQTLEDEHDAVAEEVRRRTAKWVSDMRRPNPGSGRLHGAILAGLGTGLLDELWAQHQGDEKAMQMGWQVWLDDYLAQAAEDRDADEEAGSSGPG